MKNIKDLLEKFYQGRTSNEEESLLREYFQSDNISDEFEQDKAYFDYILKASDINYLDSSFDDKIIEKIEGTKLKSMKKLQRIINVAAIIVAVVGLYFVTKDYDFIKTNNDYTTNEIKGMAITIDALSKVSRYLNETNKSLESLDKINEAFDKLNKINKINEYNKYVINKLGEKL